MGNSWPKKAQGEKENGQCGNPENQALARNNPFQGIGPKKGALLKKGGTGEKTRLKKALKGGFYPGNTGKKARGPPEEKRPKPGGAKGKTQSPAGNFPGGKIGGYSQGPP